MSGYAYSGHARIARVLAHSRDYRDLSAFALKVTALRLAESLELPQLSASDLDRIAGSVERLRVMQ